MSNNSYHTHREESSGDDKLFKFEHVVHFPSAFLFKQCHLSPLLYSRAESRSVDQSHALYRLPSMEREAVLSITTQWPSPLEVRVLPHLKARCISDMSKCADRWIECVSNVRVSCVQMPIYRAWFKLNLMDVK